MYLAVAAKSNAVYKAFNSVRAFIREDGTRPVPMYLRNAPTKLMDELGYGDGYRYAHDEAGAFAAGEVYLPEGLEGMRWYEPPDRGLEIKIGEKLARLRELNEQAAKHGKARKRKAARCLNICLCVIRALWVWISMGFSYRSACKRNSECCCHNCSATNQIIEG